MGVNLLPECLEKVNVAGVAIVGSRCVRLLVKHLLELTHHELVGVAILVHISSGWRSIAFVLVVSI